MKHVHRSTATSHKFVHTFIVLAVLISAIPMSLRTQSAHALVQRCDPEDWDCLPPGGSGGGRRGMQPGTTYVYQLETVIHGKSTSQNSETITQTQQNTTTLSAEARFTAIRWQPDETLLVQLIVTDTLVKHTDESGQLTEVPSRTQWVSNLAAPVYFELQTDGEITRFLYLPNDDRDAVNTKRGIVAAFRLRQGQNPPPITLLNGGPNSSPSVTGEQVQYTLKSNSLTTTFRKVRPNTFFKQLSQQGKLSEQDAALEQAVKDVLTNKDRRVYLPLVLTLNGAQSAAVATTSTSLTSPQQATLLDPGDSPVVGGNEFEQNSDSQVQVHTTSGVIVGVTQLQEVGTLVLDGDNPPINLADGSTVLSSATSDMQLNLLRTEATPSAPFPTNEDLDGSYHIGLDVQETAEGNATPVQPTEAATALEALRTKPEEPETLTLLVNALKSEESENVYTAAEVISALGDSGAPPLMRKAVVGALVSDGAPRAQRMLIEVGLGESPNDTAKPYTRYRDVLIGLATLSTPTDDTLATLQRLSNDANYPLREQATLTLNALVNRASGVQAQTQTQSNALPSLLSAGTALTSTFNFSRSWTKRVGRGFAWGEVHGEVQAQSTMTVPNIYLHALGTATGHLFGFTRELARAEFTSRVVTTGTNPVTYTRQFTGSVNVFGQTVVNQSFFSYGCGLTRTGDLLPQYNRTFFSVGKTFWVGVVPVRLTASMAGHVVVKYQYDIGACNAPLSANASITVTPQAWISAQGTAGVNLWIVKAGAGIYVDILKTSLPAGVRGEYVLVPGPARWQVCAEAKLMIEPLSGRLYVYVDRRKWIFFGSWRHHEWTLWRFALNPYSWTLLRECAS